MPAFRRLQPDRSETERRSFGNGGALNPFTIDEGAVLGVESLAETRDLLEQLGKDESRS